MEIDDVSLTLFPQPAFALSGVTISEDSRAGIEPFAYADALDAQVNVLGIFGASNKFSRIRLTGATLNLVKTDAAGASVSQAFTIGVSNVNEAPTAMALSGNTVAENAAGASSGTLTAAATITAALKDIKVKQPGFSGLMLPILEDARLAQRWSEGRLSLDALLSYSAVCGTGCSSG